MDNTPPPRIYWRLTGELFLWLAPATCFVWLYVTKFERPTAVVLPFYLVVFSLWIGSTGLRMLAASAYDKSAGIPYLSAMLALFPWLALLFWYSVILVGLYSWGQVTTWSIFSTYAFQSSFLLQSLGYPTWLVWVPLVLIVSVLFILGRSRYFRPDWIAALYRISPRSKVLQFSLLLCAFPIVLFASIYFIARLHPDEPIEFSLLPQLTTAQEGMVYTSSPATNQAEEAARSAYKPNRQHLPRNVVLIVGDALRADHMGVYGYGRNTTPNLAALVRSGQFQVIPQAHSVCAESLCGFTALATSRPVQSFPRHPITLHEILRRNGYKVHLALSGDHTNFYGLRQMYGELDSYSDGKDQPVRWGKEGESILRYINDDQLVLDRLNDFEDADPAHPIMLQIVLMSSHGLGPRKPEHVKYTPTLNYYKWLAKGPPPITPEMQSEIVNYYDNGVGQFDYYVKQILAILKNKGYLEDTLVIVTSDHGELLGEYGFVSHGVTVSEYVLRVPLLIGRFGYTGDRLPPHSLVSLIDIAPTVLKELEIPAPSTWQGIPLQLPEQDRLIYFQQKALSGFYFKNEQGDVIKYWHDFKNNIDAAFNMSDYPANLTNLAPTIPPRDLAEWRLRVAYGGLQAGNLRQPDLPSTILTPKEYAAPSSSHR